MRADTQNWIATAEYDLETARHMLVSQRYIYVVFMCQLALEKMFKAHVTEVTRAAPPKTHNLIRLIQKSRLELTQNHLDFVSKINAASIPTRYPEDIQRAIKDYPEVVARDYLRQTEEILKWLKQRLNLKP
jgi:HEPN domain-containing protein